MKTLLKISPTGPAFVLVAALAASPGLSAMAAMAAVEGRVTDSDGRAIEHARVETSDGAAVGYSDSSGGFRLAGVEPPVELLVTHPRFRPLTLTVAAGADAGPLAVVLEAKQEIYEQISVSATRGETNYAPVSVSSQVVDPAQAPALRTLTELVAEVPAVAENGQGGIFQTYSVRGVSRQRVLTLVAGMRIVSERRAGVSASFVDPRLMRSVDVLKGPSSTYYGSGALGGVVQLFPREFDGPAVEIGYDGQGDAANVALGLGGEDWSFGLARRRAGDPETPAGERLNSGFTQTSATFARSWQGGGTSYQLIGLASLGEDIGKANTDFPERSTVYPDERHLLLRLAADTPSGQRFEAWLHPNRLETRVTEEGAVSLVENEAFDFGANWLGHHRAGESLTFRYGVDYFARRSVTADETKSEGGVPASAQRTLDDGEEDELGLYGALEWSWQRLVVLAGGRAALQRQQNGDLPSRDDEAFTAFAGLVLPFGGGFELVGNLGTGLRFPSLSERFFTGTTGRGFVEGNPALEPESSLNADVGLRWYGDKLFLAGYLFRNDIDDYIERIETEPGRLTFENLTAGQIEGLEIEGFWQVEPSWSLAFGGALMEGESDTGEPLADVPSDRFFIAPGGEVGPWRWRARWEHRDAKNDPGSGEKAIGSAELVSVGLTYEVRPGLELSLSGRNLLDEEYFNSADRRVPLSPGRSFGLSLDWRP